LSLLIVLITTFSFILTPSFFCIFVLILYLFFDCVNIFHLNFVEIKKYGLPKKPDYYLCKIKGDKLPFRILEFWKNDIDGREINEWRYNSLLKYENIDLNEVEVTHWMKMEK
jgi:hypothetical protein